LTKRLHYIKNEDVWETRFMAPRDMADGVYRCRLILVDRQGRPYQEEKSFIIDSRPPRLQASLSQTTAHAGETVTVKVKADSDTRRISARLYGALPVPVVWSAQEKTNLGHLRIPEGLPAGTYTIRITAEDFAHNASATEVAIEVPGG
jgi:Ca-activated chloride channel family protein